MNPKARGEKGQRIAIGELAKFDIDVAVPLTDNLPFDFIIIYLGKLFRVQVKSSKMHQCNGSTSFKLTRSNWHTRTTKKYSETECDVMILCDYTSVYLIGPEEFTNRRSFDIRRDPSGNNQVKSVHSHNDYVLSQNRIDKVLGSAYFS